MSSTNVMVQVSELLPDQPLDKSTTTTTDPTTTTSTSQPRNIAPNNSTPRTAAEIYADIKQQHIEDQQRQQRQQNRHSQPTPQPPTVVPQSSQQQQQQQSSHISQTPGKRMHREIRFGNYILGSTLGEGEFGKVKLGWRKDGKHPSQVAIKLIKRSSIIKDSESEIKIHREINSLKLLNHPNIVNLVEVMKSGKYIGIVLEYASGGELFDYILHHKYLKENVAKKLFSQLVSGVDYMHSKGLIHRDLKLENLLLDKHQNVIISDFGFVNSYNREKSDLMKTSCGSPCYAAPELVLTQSPYEGRKVDIWSLGVILYAMLAGYLPFDDDPENEDGSDIIRLYHYICKTPLTFPEYVSPLARDLLRKIIIADPKKRITLDEIRTHAWLSPHAKLLSIRQPEWDKLHEESVKAKQPITPMHNTNKRFSMIPERTNSSSLMNNHNPHLAHPAPSHARSYSANSINLLYSSPSTSSYLATAVAQTPTNRTIIDSTSSSTIASSTSAIFQTPSPKHQIYDKSTSAITSSYSSASIALKAAMVHDNANDSYHYLPTQLPRSTTYTGTPISTIVESPTKQEAKNNNNLRNPPSLPPPQAQQQAQARESPRLPHSIKKPRPTSYHPSSMSSTLSSNSHNSAFDYIKIPSPIASNSPMTQYISTSPPKSENHIIKGYETPVASSRRNSSVTHINVTAVLSNKDSSISNHGGDKVTKQSSVLTYLEDKIDTLDLVGTTTTTTKHEDSENTSTTPLINHQPEFDTIHHGSGDEHGSNSHSRKGSGQDIINSPETMVNASSPPVETSKPIEIEIGSHISSSDTAVDGEGKYGVVIMEEEIIPVEEYIGVPQVVPVPPPMIVKSQKQHPSKKESTGLNRRHTVSARRTSEDNKENKDVSVSHKKRNRFSILSFYSSPEPYVRKVLEPTNDNIKDGGNGGVHQKRISSNSSSNSKAGNTKEASAARKVMDFFKRRSIRV
ncbi:uncharacterized protein J8A68_003662 [[Candida] subhashii]|uniref:non-specific serine/threonine protein kinase n=1 Tax=[Candida] subhashii TaxID=561895 RepID=A0A8J5UGZ8_9ASCO|nr:uncharacterized protein J8A68_003662 [[Candida] subhashii]KAG7662808.1 hypothetical protein J8A68_003662 [[Candida] subhashii]